MRLKRVTNRDPEAAANRVYYHVRVRLAPADFVAVQAQLATAKVSDHVEGWWLTNRFFDEGAIDLLLTDHDLAVAARRAVMNPEDLPRLSWREQIRGAFRRIRLLFRGLS